ncbi:Rhodanese-like domain-containing protein [Desulfonema limicola]|uniref:Rhodanese-like domain-containing protein n=1 Tax=Desulfonema limicola TaxID=45656 RepID=A0A975B7S6_9BACT|nr:rhodanese-like domain-containing protein [Desulfonema limicola]QTA80403.1 Rhodanese-like domain-containing protein [Desulfonema limicola]
MVKSIFRYNIMALFMLILVTSSAFAYTDVTVEEAVQLIQDNDKLIIVDIRESYEFCDENGHIVNAVNYPYNSGFFDDNYTDFSQEDYILIVCSIDNRSIQASEFLDLQGYSNVYNLSAGMEAWEGDTIACEEEENDDTPFKISLLYYPYIASNGDWETEIALINDDDAQLNGILKAYNNKGQYLSEISIELSPLSRKEIVIGNEYINPEQVNYIIFESNSENAEVKGYLKFYREGLYRASVPAVQDTEINTGDIFISHIASDSDWWTGISLLNTNSSPVELSIEFDNGIIRQKTLAANMQQTFLIRDIFDGQPQQGIRSAVIRGGSGVIGLELFGSTENSGKNYLSGILLKDDTASELYFPHIASDQNWWTGIAVYNTSNIENFITVIPFKSDGTMLASDAVSILISPYMQYATLFKDLGFPAEAAWIKIKSQEPVTGFGLFATHSGNQMAGCTGVNTTQNKGTFPKLEKNGWTGIAFVNTEGDLANITLTAYDDGGNFIADEIMEVLPYEKKVYMAEEFFKDKDISDATYIRYSSNMRIAAFQLNGSSDGMMLDGLPGR